MPDASYVQSSFLGGLWSKSMQGRTDRPDYRTALNECLNIIPIETGAAVRRSGSRFVGTTRRGLAGRLVKFDFKQNAPYNIEFTDGYMRFFTGTALVTTNDDQTIVSISAANPAKVLTGTHGWASGNQVFFKNLGSNNPLLQNRLFTATVTSATEFTLTDAITGATIDGSTLGAFVSGTVSRVKEITTPYVGTLWSSLRVVLADIPTADGTTPGAVMLQGTIKPYVLQVSTQPSTTAFATFSFAAAPLKDGPYFNPVPGGTLATPSALIGNITITLSFNAYDAARSYAIGDYVTSAGVNYKSLVDANLGSAPPSANWTAVSAADAIGPNGFTGADVGRHVRLYSEPAYWAIGTAYVKGNVVAYAGTYWHALSATTGDEPNAEPTKWALFPNGAIWTWGKILSLSNIINRALAGSASIGDMSFGGGLAAVFDGIISQVATASASESTSGGVLGGGQQVTLSSYVGKNYSGASDQKIAQAVVYPSSDLGVASTTFTAGPDPTSGFSLISLTLNLRGKASLPASPSDGTLIGTTGPIANTSSPITIISTDIVTAWKYVWIEIISVAQTAGGVATYSLTNSVAELSFFNPPGSGTSQGITVQILGDALLYTTPIRVWRLGLYSDTTGWPTCGTYHEGRLWLGGVVDNRWDASKSNDIFNFAPTASTGVVATDNAISYTFNAPDVNPILWMIPDDQGVIMGTKAGEWLAQPASAGPISPLNVAARRRTAIGCADIEPRRTDHTTVFVQKYGRKIMEYFSDVFSGKFTAPNLTVTAKHLTTPGISEIAYQQELAPIIWARLSDGTLIGATYKRDSLMSSQGPTIAGWHRHTLGSGRTIESITVGPSVGGTLDALAMVTNETASAVRHVEILQDLAEETTVLADEWLLDDAVIPSSTSSSLTPVAGAPYGGLTLYGLWHLNGKSVTVFASGLDCGDFAVTNGSAFVPYGDGVSAGTGSGLFTPSFAASANIVVGFTYTSDGQIVRPASREESGARNGPAFGKKRRSHEYAVLLNNSAGISIGTKFSTVKPLLFRSDGGFPLTPLQTFSGTWSDILNDEYSFDSMLCWRVTRPKPCNVLAIGAFLQTQDQ
jgi:hypothetical protein